MNQLSTETETFIRKHRTEDVRRLALLAAGRKDIDRTLALRQIEGWQLACHKLPLWSRTEGLLYPPRLSMEQCSSEATARYKAAVLAEYDDRMSEHNGRTFVDLTGGFGVDCSYLARGFDKAFYVERNPELCALARHNFNVLGLSHITVCNEEAEAFLEQMPVADCVFLDPARRDEHGGKTVAIPDCTPDVKALRPLLLQKARRIMVKLSPMLDISLALRDLPEVRDVHVVAVKNECKELLLVINTSLYDSDENNEVKQQTGDVTYHTINIIGETSLCSTGEAGHFRDENSSFLSRKAQVFSFTAVEEEQRSELPSGAAVGAYLYEPNAALMKAGAFRVLGRRMDIRQLHRNSHLYTADRLINDFPGRIFCVERTIGFSKKELSTLAADLEQANLTVRNFPTSVAELRKRLKIKEGGDTYLFATTLADNRRVIIQCRKTIC